MSVCVIHSLIFVGRFVDFHAYMPHLAIFRRNTETDLGDLNFLFNYNLLTIVWTYYITRINNRYWCITEQEQTVIIDNKIILFNIQNAFRRFVLAFRRKWDCTLRVNTNTDRAPPPPKLTQNKSNIALELITELFPKKITQTVLKL